MVHPHNSHQFNIALNLRLPKVTSEVSFNFRVRENMTLNHKLNPIDQRKGRGD